MKKATVLLISLLIVMLICATSCLAEASNAIAIYFLYSDNTEDPANPGVDAVTTATPYTELDFSDIAEMTNMLAARGMDTYAIVANEKYDSNFDVMVGGAEEDIDNGRQFTFESLPDLSGYTDIYLGIPVWCCHIQQSQIWEVILCAILAQFQTKWLVFLITTDSLPNTRERWKSSPMRRGNP